MSENIRKITPIDDDQLETVSGGNGYAESLISYKPKSSRINVYSEPNENSRVVCYIDNFRRFIGERESAAWIKMLRCIKDHSGDKYVRFVDVDEILPNIPDLSGNR